MTLIWLTEERVFGYLLRLGAYYSLVSYSKGGVEHEEYIENNEFTIWEDFGIKYE